MNPKIYLVQRQLVDGTWRHWKGAYSAREEAVAAIDLLRGDGAIYRIKKI